MIVRWLLASCAAIAVTLGGPCEAAAVNPARRPPPTAEPALHRRLKVSLGYHFSSGNYGTSDTTDIHYMPLVITGELSRFTLRLTVPYLYISGSAGEGPNGPVAGGGNSGGLGDVLARAAGSLPRPADWPVWVPFVDLVGVVKFPTASRSKGLGTGAFDFGIESDLTWAFGRLTPFGTVGYRVLGDFSDTHLDNIFLGTIGAAFRFIDPLSAGLLLDYRQASTSSSGQRLELVPFASWKFLDPWSLDTYVSAGLASGSPDVGVGMQCGYTW